MTEEQMKRLESIIKNWLNNGAQCNSSLKPYTRSIYPTYNPGIRSKNRRSNKLKTTKKSNRNSMIQMCEDFLRNNRI
jgi:hypothetical protein